MKSVYCAVRTGSLNKSSLRFVFKGLNKTGYERNIEAPSRNHCCRVKAITIAHSEFVSAALVIQHAMRMRHIVICGLFGSAISLHTISQTARLSGKRYST